MYLEWKVAYKPGTLEAIARDESGKEIARDKITTAGKPAAVRLIKEEQAIAADGKDLTYIYYEIVDSQGNVVPTANNLVRSNCMDKVNLSVSIMENKPAVNAIKHKQMVHGFAKPLMVRVL